MTDASRQALEDYMVNNSNQKICSVFFDKNKIDNFQIVEKSDS
jgi:hypothetical protein